MPSAESFPLDSQNLLDRPEVEGEVVYARASQGYCAFRVRTTEPHSRKFEVLETLDVHPSLDVLRARVRRRLRQGGRMVVAFPGSLTPHQHFNGCHPLIMPLITSSYDTLEIRHLPEQAPGDDPLQARDVLESLIGLHSRLRSAHPALTDAHVRRFLEDYGPRAQHQLARSGELVFLHSTPMIYNQLPWVLHLEECGSLFWPYPMGNTWDIDLHHLPCYWMVKAMLEGDACIRIFSHLSGTCQGISRLFDSTRIEQKIRYVPLGIPPRPLPGRRSEDDGCLRILFTNSWHQQSVTFYHRGGLELVYAFLHLSAQFDHIHLTLRTSLPDSLPSDLRRALIRAPNITLIPRRLSDEETDLLFESHDIFVLPSAALHTISVLRAMQMGLACIVSDAWGINELVTPEEDVLLVSGKQGTLWRYEENDGFLRLNTHPSGTVDVEYAGRLAQALSRLIGDRKLRESLGRAARKRVEREFSIEPFRRGFEQVMQEAGAEVLGESISALE